MNRDFALSLGCVLHKVGVARSNNGQDKDCHYKRVPDEMIVIDLLITE